VTLTAACVDVSVPWVWSVELLRRGDQHREVFGRIDYLFLRSPEATDGGAEMVAPRVTALDVAGLTR